MKKSVLVGLFFVVLTLTGCEREENTIISPPGDEMTLQKSGDIIPGQYVVLFKEEFKGLKSRGSNYKSNIEKVSKKGSDLLIKSKINLRKFLHTYASAIEGFALNLTESEVAELRKQPGIEIYPDKYIVLAKPSPAPVTPPLQTIPYGITRVGGGATYSGTNQAWIIDTGIDLDHSDLNVNTELQKTFVLRTKSADDDNGHGTHCAGIIAAINNTIGVVGVAAGAPVVPVKVLDRRGSGSISGVIAGVDYVAANADRGDAANLSLGGGAYLPLDQAVINLGVAGVFVAMAAGNESDYAENHSPARANGTNLYTVSACDKNDLWAYFSNYGNPPVDYCAPGVSIYSTYKGNSYATMSGTSMAAPHVCGLLLLTNGTVKSDGTVINDPDGKPDPIAHN